MFGGAKSGPVFGTSRGEEDRGMETIQKNSGDKDHFTSRSDKVKTEIDDPASKSSSSRKRTLDSDGEEKHERNTPSKRSNTADNDSEEKTNIKMMIPSAVMGSVIGKGGETIGTLQKETGCRVKISKNADFFPHTTERVALLTGTTSAIMTVITFIFEKYHDKSDLPSKVDPFDHKSVDRCKQIKLIVPSSSSGMIIGKCGEYIKSIREVTQYPVQISPKDSLDPRLGERVVTIAGRQMDDALAGVRMVLGKVALDSSTMLTSYANISYAYLGSDSQSHSSSAMGGGGGGGGSALSSFSREGRGSSSRMLGRPPSPPPSMRQSMGPPLLLSGSSYSQNASSLMGAPTNPPHLSAPPPSLHIQQQQHQSRGGAKTPPSLVSLSFMPPFIPHRATSPMRANGSAANPLMGGASSVTPLMDSLHKQPQSDAMWMQPQTMNVEQRGSAAPLLQSGQSSSSSAGMGNFQVLQFLDGLKTTLRSHNYNDTAILDITQAMTTLARYNVLGLGLGLGLSSISKAEPEFGQAISQPPPQPSAQLTSLLPPVNQQTQSMLSNVGFAGFDAAKAAANTDVYFSRSMTSDHSAPFFTLSNASSDQSQTPRDDSSLGYVSRSTLRAEERSPMRSRSPPRSVASAYGSLPMFHESRRDDAKIELSVPESAIGAVLGKQGRNLADIQRYSGARIDVSKRESYSSSGSAPDRVIVIQGATEAIIAARRKIDSCIDESRRGRRRGGDDRY